MTNTTQAQHEERMRGARESAAEARAEGHWETEAWWTRAACNEADRWEAQQAN